MRKAIACAALAAALASAQAPAATTTTELMPGVTYTREVRRTPAGPLVLHVVTAPAPGGLYDLKPVLSNDLVTGRETVSSMQRRKSTRATLVGVNGDLFNWTLGNPSGMYMSGGALVTRPQNGRSSLGFGLDGLLRVDRIKYWGAWKIAAFPAHPLFHFNRPLDEGRDIGMFTPAWGPRTPRLRGGVEVVVGPMPAAVPNTDLETNVVAVRHSTGGSIPAGAAVIQARNVWRKNLLAEAAAGRRIVLHLKLTPWWEGAVEHAIGGGPVLVRDGGPIFNAGEQFSPYQLRRRHPRTAVGQLWDGRIVFLAIDGRRAGSIGVTTSQLAAEMARLGTRTAMALDGGGSTTLAVDGQVLNRPSDGRERAVSNAVMVFYHGAYARPPRFDSFSPNGDGIREVQRLAVKIVHPSQVDVQLLRPNGELAWRYQASVAPTTIKKELSGAGLAEGRWRWVVRAVDEQGRQSEMAREFTVNSTLGFLRLSKRRMAVRRRRGGRLVASWRLANAADLRVRVENAAGKAIRRLYARPGVAPGSYAVVWNGKNRRGRVVKPGLFRIEVRAVNPLGAVTLERAVRVRKVRRAR